MKCILLTIILFAAAVAVRADGFVHPGMFHTAADFDRIRTQLAEGDAQVTAGYQVLLNAAYGQSTAYFAPVDTIRRGSSIDNYITAARAAAVAYQNALRWQIDGSETHAANAVKILNAWARTTKCVTGDSNSALATGLYAYEFANAAELLRDYGGWAPTDFAMFRQWMLDVWKPGILNFLCSRWGTWENESYIGKVGWGIDGQRPGHYWSNWGLCNVLSLMSIGILCDDVELYNRAVSFYAFDQQGTFADERGETIRNDGCNEFIGNLVPVTFVDDRGPYGRLGQMQESGRDQGHTLLAVGLALDICQTAWNQGDDLFSLMDCRLAAGIEYVAAYNYGLLDDLPFTTYIYADCRTAWHNATYHYSNSDASRGELRNIWCRALGHYEGVKGVEMQWSRLAAETVGVDGGGTGGVSGPYDHLGYTTLTCTRPKAETAPPVITPWIITADGDRLQQSQLGALVNNYAEQEKPLEAGTRITLSPEADTDGGTWLWSDGSTDREITVEPHRGSVYAVVYTAPDGSTATQSFTIAAEDDGTLDQFAPSTVLATFNGGLNAWYTQSAGATDPIITATGRHAHVVTGQQTSGKWRADLMFASDAAYPLDADRDRILAIKFIGESRPSGNMKMEIMVDGAWCNTQWNSGRPDGTLYTTQGNIICYYDLTRDASYASGSLNKLNFKIAECSIAGEEYTVDWIATFDSVETLSLCADWADDGAADPDELKSEQSSVTQINALTMQPSAAAWYTLQGRRIDNPRPGAVYILVTPTGDVRKLRL